MQEKYVSKRKYLATVRSNGSFFGSNSLLPGCRYLEVQNNGPYKSQSKLRISFDNVFWPDIYCFDLNDI